MDMTHPDILRIERFGELEPERYEDGGYDEYLAAQQDEYRDREVTFDE